MIGLSSIFTGTALRVAMGTLALVGVAAAVPASARPMGDHGYGSAQVERHDEGRGHGYGRHHREWREHRHHGRMHWHHERHR